MKEYVGRVVVDGVTVTVTLCQPEGFPMKEDDLEDRAALVAAVGIGTFGLVPTEANAFLSACIRTLKSEIAALDAYEN